MNKIKCEYDKYHYIIRIISQSSIITMNIINNHYGVSSVKQILEILKYYNMFAIQLKLPFIT